MPGGQPLRLGPFTGGINTLSDTSAIADAELVDCNNYELDIDGSLICRPPFQHVLNNTGFAERIVLIGVALLNGNTYVIGSNSGGVYYWVSNAWTLITNTFQATCMVQYANKIWLVAKIGSANPGGSWDGTTFTAIAAIPKGSAAVIHKERMFVVPGITATTNESRLIFSNAGNFATWTGTDFLDVRSGDGQHLVDLVVYQDNLLLFKEDSTFIFAFDIKPSDGIVRQLSSTLGTTKQHCVVNYESSVFFYHEGEVYEVVNLDFNRINAKVIFFYDPTVPVGGAFVEDVFLSIFGDRLIVRYFNRIYVYGLRTRTWTRWASSSDELHYFGPIVSYPSNVVAAVNDQYFAGSCINTKKNLIRMNDGRDASVDERDSVGAVNISCAITTKTYDLAISHQFKRLFWWGADVLSGNSVTGVATPIVASFQSTWDDLTNWDALNTWDYPLSSPASTTTSVGASSGVMRKFVKFAKGLRFRQINFGVTILSTGKTTDGPARIYSLTALVRTAATVGQGSN